MALPTGCVNILSKGKPKAYTPVAPLGLSRLWAIRCYTPVAPLGLRCSFQNRGYKPLLQAERNA